MSLALGEQFGAARKCSGSGAVPIGSGPGVTARCRPGEAQERRAAAQEWSGADGKEWCSGKRWGQSERQQRDTSERALSVKQIIYLHIRPNAQHSRGTPGAAEHVACTAMEQCRQPEGSKQNHNAILGAGGHRRMLGTSEKGHIMDVTWCSHGANDPLRDHG